MTSQAGASVNFYMFHGGTNFGFMNGANATKDSYQAHVTSYDYGAPLSEWGEPSPSFLAIPEQCLKNMMQLPPLPVPSSPAKLENISEPSQMTESVPLWDVLDDLSKAHQSVSPLPMEDYNQDYGFILYRTYLSGPRDEATPDRPRITRPGTGLPGWRSDRCTRARNRRRFWFKLRYRHPDPGWISWWKTWDGSITACTC